MTSRSTASADSPMTMAHPQEQELRLFQPAADGGSEGGVDGAVDESVVDRVGERHHGPHGQFPVDDPGPGGDAAESDDADLGGVDHWGSVPAADGAVVREGERAAGQLGHGARAVPGGLADPAD